MSAIKTISSNSSRFSVFVFVFFFFLCLVQLVFFNVSGTTQPSLKLSNVPLVAGTVYTVYVSGPANALQGIVTQDKAF